MKLVVLRVCGDAVTDTRLQGGTIRGSINLPAQSLFPTMPTLYVLFKAAGVKKVIWYCGEFGLSGSARWLWWLTRHRLLERPGDEGGGLVWRLS